MAGKYDFTIEQGATFCETVAYKTEADQPIDLTGYSARMQIRKQKLSEDVLFELTTDPDKGITIDGKKGLITLLITADETENFNASGFYGVYDLELVADDVVIRLIEGNIYVSSEVTKPV